MRAGVEDRHLDRTALLHALEEIDDLLLAQVGLFAARARRQHDLVRLGETAAERRA